MNKGKFSVFSREERQFIKDNCNTLTIDELCAHLPGRTRRQVVQCSYQLGKIVHHEEKTLHVIPESLKDRFGFYDDVRDERLII